MTQRTLLAFVCLLGLSVCSFGQTNEASKTTPAKNVAVNSKAEKDPEAERMARERRAHAQNLLITLAAEAGRFNDQTLRARTQARIADVLWEADPERARALFRKAWESAEIVDQEAQRKLQEDMRQQTAKGGGSVVNSPPNIRGEVLRLAAKRDRALGEELLAKLKVEKAQESTETSDRAKSDPFMSPEGMRQRLSLARQLLSTDVERAVEFADPALGAITREAIDFLSYLREKDAGAADQRYMALMANAANSLQSDANTVSLLSSYLFTPHVFVTFSGGGGASTMSTNSSTGPIAIAPEVTNSFFRVAASILSRPVAAPGQDQTSAGAQGKYLMIKRLLPLFEQVAPKELTEMLRGQMDALATTMSEDLRQRDDDAVREGIRPPQSGGDREKALRDRIDRAKTSEERDALYLQLARLYVDNLDFKARDFVDKIEDSDMRQQARGYIDASLTMRAIDKKDTDKALEILRIGELTHLQKSWALLQVVKLIAKTDREKALTILEEATGEARRIEDSDPDRSRVLMGVANAWLVLDRSKIWDAVGDAIRAANSAEGYTGEDGMMRMALRTKQTSSTRSSSAQDFDVTGIFGELAKEDYNRAVEVARGFEHEAPRASATIAIAKVVLEEKKK
jgi:hypothetical protein